MKNFLIITIFLILVIAGNALSNDGFADHTAEGLVFSKTEGISVERERLTITSSRIDVEFVFRNTTDKDIHTVIAFPIPDIVCDTFTSWDYPEGFTATVNGNMINLKTEIRAVLGSDYGKWWWQKTDLKKDQDITEFLASNHVSLDCRKFPEFRKSYEELRTGKLSPEYSKIVELGLACCDPLSDPPEVDYITRIKYYWEQTFPAKQTLTINHSYKPSLGAWNGFYDSMTDLKKQIDIYKPFYEKHFKEEARAGKFKYNTPFRYLNYILTTANTWHGPIKEFSLVLPSSGNLIVTTMDGPLEMIKGNLEIHKKNFSPTKDMTVFFFQD